MYVLIFNCGSSSIKFQLIQSTNYSVIAKGILERIGLDKSKLTFKTNNHTYEIKNNIHNHEAGAELIFTALTNKEYAVLSDLNEITVVGHRVVHGGEKYSGAMLINNDVEKEITACSQLAPLHNPANLTGIKACKNLLKGIPQVAVFDTAFHQSIPDFAYRYAIPEEYYREMKIRKYGFHGTSHKYVFERACQILKKNMIQSMP